MRHHLSALGADVKGHPAAGRDWPPAVAGRNDGPYVKKGIPGGASATALRRDVPRGPVRSTIGPRRRIPAPRPAYRGAGALFLGRAPWQPTLPPRSATP